jgi:two-component system cell cycle response regulator
MTLCASLEEMRDGLSGPPFDLVITASELPDGNYLDVLSGVRKRDDMALVPVLLLIAGRNEHIVQQAFDKGMTEVFFKRDLDDLASYLENFSNSSLAGRGRGTVLRALVVEDDRALGSYYKQFLTRYGFLVDHVPSGEAALWEAERHGYDFILVDLVLQGSCSGIQFLRRLRQPTLASSRAVAIAMSGYADEARRLEALRAGANAFIAKPVDETELAAHIIGMTQRSVGKKSKQDREVSAPPVQQCKRCEPCQLTPRESNICSLVAMGFSDKRIAEDMGVSYWTVRTHIAHAFKKCEVGNRVELVRRLQGD